MVTTAKCIHLTVMVMVMDIPTIHISPLETGIDTVGVLAIIHFILIFIHMAGGEEQCHLVTVIDTHTTEHMETTYMTII